MTHFVDKSAVVAEIEKRIKEIEETGTYLSPKGTLTNLLCYINSIEVKEMDLDSAVERYVEQHKSEFQGYIDLRRIARHFYVLGVNAQKGE